MARGTIDEFLEFVEEKKGRQRRRRRLKRVDRISLDGKWGEIFSERKYFFAIFLTNVCSLHSDQRTLTVWMEFGQCGLLPGRRH